MPGLDPAVRLHPESTLTARARADTLTPGAATALGMLLLSGVVIAAGWVGPPGFAHPFTSWGGLLHPDGVWPDWNRWPGLALAGSLGAFAVVWCVVFRQARRMAWCTRTVWWMGAGWIVPVALGPPILSNDVFSYVAQGAVARTGQDPTRLSPFALGWSSPLLQAVDPRWRETPSPYGPLATLIEKAGADDHPVLTIVGLRLLALLAVAGAAGLLVRLARRADPASRTGPSTTLLLTWANPPLILHVVASVHFEGVLLLLVVSAVSCAQGRGRIAPFTAVALAVAAAAVKLPVGLVVLAVIALAVLRRVDDRAARVRQTLGLATVAVGVWTALCLIGGTGWNVLAVVSTPTRGRTPAAPATLLADLLTPLRWWGLADGPVLDHTGRVLAAVAGVVVIVILLVTSTRRPVGTTVGGALLTLALGSPVLYPWYLAWSIPLLALDGRPGLARRLALLSALSAVMTVQGLTRAETFVLVCVVVVATVTAVVATEPRGRDLLDRARRSRAGAAFTGSSRRAPADV